MPGSKGSTQLGAEAICLLIAYGGLADIANIDPDAGKMVGASAYFLTRFRNRAPLPMKIALWGYKCADDSGIFTH
jgi:hypothetical protein